MIVVMIFIHGTPSAADESTNNFKCPGTKRVLVLGGGGVRGAYQIGALWYLVNVLNCEFDDFVGTSTGAVTAAQLAQAKTQQELKRQVDSLTDGYHQLHNKNDIVEERTFGLPRLFLPRWLGGVDGLGSLAPLERRLRSQLDSSSIPPDKLTVVAVSLQAGTVDPTVYRAHDLIDLVVGSASIPVAIEPHRARMWLKSEPQLLKDDVLTVASSAAIPPKLQHIPSSSSVVTSAKLRQRQRGLVRGVSAYTSGEGEAFCQMTLVLDRNFRIPATMTSSGGSATPHGLAFRAF